MSPKRDNTPAKDDAAPQKPSAGRAPDALRPSGRLADEELMRARLFCGQAGAEVEAIGLDRAVRDLRDTDRLVGQLTRIQREAKRARARGIYRSAQDVLNAVQCRAEPDWARVDARLFVLSRLMEQYESGLDDVEAQFAAHDEPIAPPAGSAHQTHYEMAHTTLTQLLPHASSEERSALERLMGVDLTASPLGTSDAPDGLETSENASDPFALVVIDNPAVRTDDADQASDNALMAVTETVPLAPLDTILPDLVQRLLGVAHQFGKIVSVSHAVDQVRVPETRLPGLQADLYEALSARIASEMPLQGVGHLDISAGNDVLEITGSGIIPFSVPLAADAARETARPSWRPMITDETEADLRAQLAALLDGGF